MHIAEEYLDPYGYNTTNKGLLTKDWRQPAFYASNLPSAGSAALPQITLPPQTMTLLKQIEQDLEILQSAAKNDQPLYRPENAKHIWDIAKTLSEKLYLDIDEIALYAGIVDTSKYAKAIANQNRFEGANDWYAFCNTVVTFHVWTKDKEHESALKKLSHSFRMFRLGKMSFLDYMEEEDLPLKSSFDAAFASISHTMPVIPDNGILQSYREYFAGNPGKLVERYARFLPNILKPALKPTGELSLI